MMASLRWTIITLKGVQRRRYKGSLDEKKPYPEEREH